MASIATYYVITEGGFELTGTSDAATTSFQMVPIGGIFFARADQEEEFGGKSIGTSIFDGTLLFHCHHRGKVTLKSKIDGVITTC